MKKVFVNIDKCTACKACELACAVEHSSSRNLFSAIFEFPRPMMRTHVEKADGHSYAVRCIHCADAPCMEACPTAALSRDEKTGAVLINDDRCMGCMMCAMVCPFGAISLYPEKKVAVKCDFCIARREEGREPACVEACPTEALVYGEEEELIKSKRIKTAETVLAAIGRMEKGEPAGTPGH